MTNEPEGLTGPTAAEAQAIIDRKCCICSFLPSTADCREYHEATASVPTFHYFCIEHDPVPAMKAQVGELIRADRERTEELLRQEPGINAGASAKLGPMIGSRASVKAGMSVTKADGSKLGPDDVDDRV